MIRIELSQLSLFNICLTWKHYSNGLKTVRCADTDVTNNNRQLMLYTAATIIVSYACPYSSLRAESSVGYP